MRIKIIGVVLGLLGFFASDYYCLLLGCLLHAPDLMVWWADSIEKKRNPLNEEFLFNGVSIIILCAALYLVIKSIALHA